MAEGSYASESGHWYGPNGEPAYEIEGRDGRMRPTTLRDARQLDLAPSVTMIIRCAAAPALERWKQAQVLASALNLRQLDGEDEGAFKSRILGDAQEVASKAATLGSAIHGCIEKHLLGEVYNKTYSEHVAGAVEALDKWCGVEGVSPEKSFRHPLGYGGKCDIHKKPEYVVDFKSKEFSEENLPRTYDNHAMQLAAYREGFSMPNARGAIIYVSTLVPGLTHTVELAEDELARGWNMFRTLLSFWQLKNKFVPGEGV